MGIRKLETLNDINELGLDSNSVCIIAVHGYSISVLVDAGRRGELKSLDGIGKVTEQKIMTALDNAGLIFHEPVMSARIRQLLIDALGCSPETAEEYEAQTEFVDEQRDRLFTLLDTFTEQEALVLKMRYGLTGAEPMTLRQVALEFGVSQERIRQVEAKAIRKLRHPSRRKELADIFPNWVDSKLNEPECCARYEGPVEEMPIEQLPCISTRTYYCLKRVGIHKVSHLLQRSYADVEKIRNLTKRCMYDLTTSLAMLGLALEEESGS